jgi:hypothetical protein
MKIKMEFIVEGHHIVEAKDIPLPMVADRLLKTWLTKQDWWNLSPRGYYVPSCGDLYGVLALPPDEKEPLNQNFFSCQPIFRIYEMDNWLVIKWQYSEPSITKSSTDLQGWFFFHYEVGSGYRLIDIPESCKVDPVTGNIAVKTNINVTLVKAFSPPWPNPLLEDRYAAIGLLDKLMQLREENPLSILLKSQQPYSGLAKQVVEELQRVKGFLTTKYLL